MKAMKVGPYVQINYWKSRSFVIWFKKIKINLVISNENSLAIRLRPEPLLISTLMKSRKWKMIEQDCKLLII